MSTISLENITRYCTEIRGYKFIEAYCNMGFLAGYLIGFQQLYDVSYIKLTENLYEISVQGFRDVTLKEVEPKKYIRALFQEPKYGYLINSIHLGYDFQKFINVNYKPLDLSNGSPMYLCLSKRGRLFYKNNKNITGYKIVSNSNYFVRKILKYATNPHTN